MSICAEQREGYIWSCRQRERKYDKITLPADKGSKEVAICWTNRIFR